MSPRPSKRGILGVIDGSSPKGVETVLRAMQTAGITGIKAILVHAISPGAKHFYEKHGLAASPVDPMTLIITIAEAAKMLSNEK